MTDPEQTGSEQAGLYEKYEVRKDGEPVEDCFVLEPQADLAAREALLTYADATEDEKLASDLREWIHRGDFSGEAAEAGDRHE